MKLTYRQIGYLYTRKITPRQIDVCSEVISGESNKSIAKSLGITERCVKNYLTGVFKQTDTKSRAQLIVKLNEIERAK